MAALMYSKSGCGNLSAYYVREIICDTADPYWWGSPWCPLADEPAHVNALGAVGEVGGPLCAMLGDLDCDGLVSGYDLASFDECMNGPGVPYADVSCACTDFPASPPDGDVDLRDLYAFQTTFDGMGSGACCHADGTCSITTIYDCLAEEGAVYNGHDSTCADTDCVMTRYANVTDSPGAYIPAGAGLQIADDITLSGTGGGLLTHYELLVYGGAGTFNVTAELYTGCPGEGGTGIAGTEHTFNGNPGGVGVELAADFDPPVYIPDTADYPIWMVVTFSNSMSGWAIAEEAEVGYTADYFGLKLPPWGCSYYYPEGPYSGLWALIECAKVTGACCLADQSCMEGTEADCTAVSGVYQGHGTTCAQVNCSTATGACCRPDGTCFETNLAGCNAQGGTFHQQVGCAAVDCTPERYSNTTGPPYYALRPNPGYQLADDLTLGAPGAGPLIHYDIEVSRPAGTYNVTAELHTACPPTDSNKIAGTLFSWSNLAGGQIHTLNADFSPVWISSDPNGVWLRVQFDATDAGWIIAEQAETGSTQNKVAAHNGSSWGCNYGIQNHWAGLWANLTFGGGLDAAPEAVTWVESEVPSVPPVMIPISMPEGVEPARILAPEPVRYVPGGTPIFRAGDVARRRATPDPIVTLYLGSSVAGQTIAPGTTVDWTIRAEVSPSGNKGLALLSTDLRQQAGNQSLFDIPPATSIGPLMAPFDRPDGISNPGPGGSAFGGTPFGTPGAMNLAQIGGSQNTFGMPGVECGLETAVTTGIGQSGPVVVASGSFPAPLTPGEYTFWLFSAVATVLNDVYPEPTPPAHWPVSPATMNFAGAYFTITVEAPCIGDLNCDGVIGFGDINAFVEYQSNFAAWQAEFPGCNPLNGDINCDGTYGQGAFGDINPFTWLMGQCGSNCDCPGPIICP